MSSIQFVDYQTIIPASWLNDVNALVYSGTLPATSLTLQNLVVNNSLSGAGVTAMFASPGAIGSAAPNTGAFTNMTISGTLSGSGIANYFAAPPAIGNSSANAGNFTSLNASGQVNFNSTGAMLIPRGTTAERPVIGASGLRFNTESVQFEGYNGTDWASVGGAAISNDTTTGLPVYPLFANATTGTALTVYTSDTNLLYTPSIGEFQASIFNASNGIFVNSQIITRDCMILGTNNAGSFGPMAIAEGITVTVSTNSTWSII